MSIKIPVSSAFEGGTSSNLLRGIWEEAVDGRGAVSLGIWIKSVDKGLTYRSIHLVSEDNFANLDLLVRDGNSI